MIIIHLSDFHLNKETLKDWSQYTKPALFKLLESEFHSFEELYFVCTGDLIDKGGEDYSGVSQALSVFTDSVINPILTKTGLSLDHFLIVAGNHDIDRKADEDYQVLGLRSAFDNNGVSSINEYVYRIINNSDFVPGTKRVSPFVEYAKNLYKDCANVSVSNLGMTSRFVMNGVSIGFSCLNSSWNAFNDDFDYGVVIGEDQYNRCLNDINDCDIKVALMHHPLDWLKKEKDTIVSHFYQDFNMFLAGHVHEKQTSFNNDFYGSLFVNIAPKYTNEIRKKSDACGSFANGFTTINYDKQTGAVFCKYFTYSFQDKCYVLDSEKCPEGQCAFQIPQKIDPTLNSRITNCIKYINDNRIPRFNEQIIPLRANAITNIVDAFVQPPIYKNADDYNQLYTIDDIINNNSNQLLFGAHESGKSIILYRILIEFVRDFQRYGLVPVYINFLEIGNREIESIIREFCDIKSQDVKDFVKAKKIILLVDDYSPSFETILSVKRLYEFAHDNDVRMIATSESETGHIITESFSKYNKIAFEYYFIDQFRAENIKSLMMKWSPTDEFNERTSKLEQLVNRFCSFSLPCTAMSVSLYLWSTENSEREPINQAVLLDIYMDIILEKLSVKNIYRSSFDYENKIALLSYIAYFVHNEFIHDNTFILEYGTYINQIGEYLNKQGFQKKFDPIKLGDYFIEQKVFIREGNNISFAHTCFYYFLLAQRMRIDNNFKNHVLSEENFFKYGHVIDYYGGLNRSDESLLKFLLDKIQTIYSKVQGVYDEVDFDSCFTIVRQGQNGYTPAIDVTEPRHIVETRPTKEQIEKKLVEVSNKKLDEINETINEGVETVKKDPLAVLFMLATALRNLDTIENAELKQETYNTVVKNALIYTVVYKNSLARYANEHKGKLPVSFAMVKNVDLFFRFMPYNLQNHLFSMLNTPKLLSFIENKLEQDYKSSSSDIEKYFSVSMLWDIEGLSAINEIKKLIKTVGRNSVQDYLLIKLITKLYKLAPKSEFDDDLIDLIASLKIKNMKLGRFRKGNIIKSMKDERFRQKLIPNS